MRFWAGSITCALLAGCQTVPSAPAGDLTGPDGLAFEVKSWGAVVHSWAILADGSATSTTRLSPSGSPRPPYTLEYRRFVVPPDKLAQVRALAAAIPRPVPSDDSCQQRMTDAAYGTLSLVFGDETEDLEFYGGCFDAYYAPYIAKVMAIDVLVMAQSDEARVERREEVAADSN